jgi:hypothetical protein
MKPVKKVTAPVAPPKIGKTAKDILKDTLFTGKVSETVIYRFSYSGRYKSVLRAKF